MDDGESVGNASDQQATGQPLITFAILCGFILLALGQSIAVAAEEWLVLWTGSPEVVLVRTDDARQEGGTWHADMVVEGVYLGNKAEVGQRFPLTTQVEGTFDVRFEPPLRNGEQSVWVVHVGADGGLVPQSASFYTLEFPIRGEGESLGGGGDLDEARSLLDLIRKTRGPEGGDRKRTLREAAHQAGAAAFWAVRALAAEGWMDEAELRKLFLDHAACVDARLAADQVLCSESGAGGAWAGSSTRLDALNRIANGDVLRERVALWLFNEVNKTVMDLGARTRFFDGALKSATLSDDARRSACWWLGKIGRTDVSTAPAVAKLLLEAARADRSLSVRLGAAYGLAGLQLTEEQRKEIAHLLSRQTDPDLSRALRGLVE